MSKLKIDREICIGCGSCVAICPKYFELSEDGKSSIKGSNGANELEVEKIECAESAAETCPVQCIYIEK